MLIYTLVCFSIGLSFAQDSIWPQETAINKQGCTNYVTIMSNAKPTDAPIEKSILLWQGIVLLVCFGAFALIISLLHRVVR